MTLTAKRYAQALFEAAPAAARDAVAGDLESIGRVLEDPTARVAVTDPTIPKQARLRACSKLAEGAQPIVQNFVQVLLERRREAVLLDIASSFRELLLESRGEVVGVLETAGPLESATITALEGTASRLSGKTVSLRVQENRDLIGGVRMRVGNTLFDSSVATAIEELERKLMSAPL